jgi:hypothetical protein
MIASNRASSSTSVGESDVEHRHVGSERREPGERLGRRGHLAHDLEVVLGVDQLPEAGPDDLVVIEERDADGHGPHHGPGVDGIVNQGPDPR